MSDALMTPVVRDGWEAILPDEPRSDWQSAVSRIVVEAEARRAASDYDTGSITPREAYQLRALAEATRARVIVEVGTFIGTSTCALASSSTVERVYTCDASNDCLPSDGRIVAYPRQTSTAMLHSLIAQDVRAELCFFDGVLSEADVTLLSRICGPRAVFALHDVNYGPKLTRGGVLKTVPRKGIGNMRLLRRQWMTHRVLDPLPETTLAVLWPTEVA